MNISKTSRLYRYADRYNTEVGTIKNGCDLLVGAVQTTSQYVVASSLICLVVILLGALTRTAYAVVADPFFRENGVPEIGPPLAVLQNCTTTGVVTAAAIGTVFILVRGFCRRIEIA